MIDLQRLDGYIDDACKQHLERIRSRPPAPAARMSTVLTEAQGLYTFSSYAWLAGPQ